MKKVNLIGKKIMSAGLAASLLVTSLGNTSCFAEDPTTSAKTAVSTQQNKKDESGNITNNVTIQVINILDRVNKSVSKNKDVSVNKKEELKKYLKKAFNVTKWVFIIGLLAYAGYKNGKDLMNCLKECRDFIVENKDNFQEVLNGGIATIKVLGNATIGLGNAAKGTAQLIWKIISFVAKHTEATKNVLATVGTYSIYKSLKNKISKLI